jgi:hypothetical protein
MSRGHNLNIVWLLFIYTYAVNQAYIISHGTLNLHDAQVPEPILIYHAILSQLYHKMSVFNV